MASACDRLNAYVTHESDEDAAEFAARLDAYRAEVLREAAANSSECCAIRLRRMAEDAVRS